MSTGSNELARVSDRVVVVVVGDRAVAPVDRDDPRAVRAAAGVRSAVPVEGDVPLQCRSGPVAGGPHEQVDAVPHEVVRPVGRPAAARALGEQDLLVGVGVARDRLLLRRTAVAVERGAVDVRARGRIVQHVYGVVRQRPVVIEREDLRARPGQRRPEVLRGERGLVGRRHPHARVVVRHGLRLVLDGDAGDGQPLLAVAAHEPGQVGGVLVRVLRASGVRRSAWPATSSMPARSTPNP